MPHPQLFFIMGLPSVMTTDQGTESHNRVNRELMKVFGIQHRLTTAYHPQANGLDERLNQTLANSLAKYAQGNREAWDETLQQLRVTTAITVEDDLPAEESKPKPWVNGLTEKDRSTSSHSGWLADR